MIDPVEFGKAMGLIVRDAVAPLLKRIEELEARQPIKGEPGTDGKNGQDGASVTADDVAPLIAEQVNAAIEAIPTPKDGTDGRDGVDGKNAEPIVMADVVTEILSTDALKTLVDLHVAEAVGALPPPKNGVDGDPGPPGDAGLPGEKGERGVGLAGAVIDRDGALVVTLSNGETKALGVIVGNDGAPGRDGFGFDDLSASYDGERGMTLTFTKGERVKEFHLHLPVVIDRGYWREGTQAKAGDAMTHDGTLWIAVRDTQAKPARESEDWRIGARKGRDGLQGPPGKDFKPAEPVRLGGSHD